MTNSPLFSSLYVLFPPPADKVGILKCVGCRMKLQPKEDYSLPIKISCFALSSVIMLITIMKKDCLTSIFLRPFDNAINFIHKPYYTKFICTHFVNTMKI